MLFHLVQEDLIVVNASQFNNTGYITQDSYKSDKQISVTAQICS